MCSACSHMDPERCCEFSAKRPRRRIVNVSSGVGSLTRTSDPAYPYRSIFSPVYLGVQDALSSP